MLPPPILVTGRRCIIMEHLISFLIAVMAGVACHCINKWLDKR